MKTYVVRITFLIALFPISTGISTVVASAVSKETELHLKIRGLECVVDELYTGVNLQYNINPDDCEQNSINENLPPSSAQSLRSTPLTGESSDSRLANRPSNDDSPLEQFAAWLGSGSTSVVPVRPVVAGSAIAGVTAASIDGLFFEFQYTLATYAFTKRSTKKIVRLIKRSWPYGG